jgi:predicted RNase H-like HicB family nuclease
MVWSGTTPSNKGIQPMYEKRCGHATTLTSTLSAQRCMNIQFTTRTFKEGRKFVAQAIDLDVSSCGDTKESALRNLKEALTLYLGEAEKMGTLREIFRSAGKAGAASSFAAANPSVCSVWRFPIR